MNGLLASQSDMEMHYENVRHRQVGMGLHCAEEASLGYINSVFLHEPSVRYLANIDPQHFVRAGRLQRHPLRFEMPIIRRKKIQVLIYAKDFSVPRIQPYQSTSGGAPRQHPLQGH